MKILNYYISESNSKMGLIPSFSMPPGTTCAEGVPCTKECYACKLAKIRPSLAKSWNNNLTAFQRNPETLRSTMHLFFGSLSPKFFRWNVAGDFADARYFSIACDIARAYPGTRFLAFTKCFDVVNAAADAGTIPANFSIIFSAWEGLEMDNPHNFPIASVYTKAPPKGAYLCGGNCDTCGYCFFADSGETLAFKKH